MTAPADVSADSLRAWLIDRVAAYLQCSPDTIRPDTPLADYGLDSVYALTMCADIEDHLGIDLEPTVMWDNPTVDALTEAVLAEAAARA